MLALLTPSNQIESFFFTGFKSLVHCFLGNPSLIIYSVGYHMCDVVLMRGEAFTQWWYEERGYMLKAVLSYFFGVMQVNFELTNKVVDEEQIKRYVFDFQGTGLLLVPLTTVAITNLVCFVGGVWRMVIEGSYDLMLGQVVFSSLVLIYSYPLLEGI